MSRARDEEDADAAAADGNGKVKRRPLIVAMAAAIFSAFFVDDRLKRYHSIIHTGCRNCEFFVEGCLAHIL